MRRHAESVQAEYERLATLIDNVQIALAMTDAAGRSTLINNAWEQITGYWRAAGAGPALRGLAERDLVAASPRCSSACSRPGGTLSSASSSINQPGSRRAAISISRSYRSAAPAAAITGALGAAVDVTEKVHARQQLEAQRALFRTMIAVAPGRHRGL